MDDEEPVEFTVKGVVRNGQVVLEAPLDVPDGTFVTIQRYCLGDIAGEAWPPPTPEQLQAIRDDLAWLRAKAGQKTRNEQGGQEAA
jgi:hypothetical protein